MAVASEAHNLVLANPIMLIGQQLGTRPCRVYPATRVRVGGFYAYPDASVVRGERKFVDGRFDTLANPVLIFEVLSPSTEGYDRGLKFKLYKTIETLQQYVLICGDRMGVDLLTRQADGSWKLTSSEFTADVVELQSIDCRLKLADVYDKVEFPPR